MTSQVIGGSTLVTIEYHRPGVKGRDVWGDSSPNPVTGRLVPHDGNPRPWLAGANEATNFETTSDVLVEGQALPAGKYARFMIPTDGEWTLIHKCAVCGHLRTNRIAGDDHELSLLSLALRPLARAPFPIDDLRPGIG